MGLFDDGPVVEPTNDGGPPFELFLEARDAERESLLAQHAARRRLLREDRVKRLRAFGYELLVVFLALNLMFSLAICGALLQARFGFFDPIKG